MPCPADLLSGNWLATKLRPAEPFNCAEEKKYFSLSGSRSPQNIQIEKKYHSTQWSDQWLIKIYDTRSNWQSTFDR